MERVEQEKHENNPLGCSYYRADCCISFHCFTLLFLLFRPLILAVQEILTASKPSKYASGSFCFSSTFADFSTELKGSFLVILLWCFPLRSFYFSGKNIFICSLFFSSIFADFPPELKGSFLAILLRCSLSGRFIFPEKYFHLLTVFFLLFFPLFFDRLFCVFFPLFFDPFLTTFFDPFLTTFFVCFLTTFFVCFFSTLSIWAMM